MNNIELIRQKRIEANPEIENTYVLDSFWEINKVETAKIRQGRPIHLADVLLALPNPEPLSLYPNRLLIGTHPAVFWWNLRKDDLTEQSEETITFLAELFK